MTGKELKQGRVQKGWTQQTAASRLEVSQAYLSLLEAGTRSVGAKLAKKAFALYGTPATTLPLDESFQPPPSDLDSQRLAEALAGLGYPGFSHLRSHAKSNPAEVLFAALGQKDL